MRERSTPDEPESLAAHAGFLRSLARGLLFDRSAADDVAQKALLIALQKPVVRNTWRKDPRDGTPAFSLRGWLAGVVRNLARERGREDARRAERERAGA